MAERRFTPTPIPWLAMIPRRQIPNALTMLRLVLAAAFFIALGRYAPPTGGTAWAVAAIILFIVAALTDALDGHLARKWNATSAFGRVMDPFCDKVLVLGALVYLAGPAFRLETPPDNAPDWLPSMSGFYPWMAVVILARELLVTSIRSVMEGLGVAFGAKWAGKLKMILQSVVVPVVLTLQLAAPPAEHTWSLYLVHILSALTVAATLLSAGPYLRGLAIASRSDGPGDGA
jgi:CDP-diacylglycerol--glycerol-3-phosphate 3-phosphatidyltransferase